MLEARIYITLKTTVADPQGLTIKHALEALEYKEVETARIGKLIILRLDTDKEDDAKIRLNEMCRRLLANPVIEDYSFELRAVDKLPVTSKKVKKI
jgi:phosphoribosylformylglycinamidine synthase subunit PurS